MDPLENVHDRRALPLLQDGGPPGIALNLDIDPGREILVRPGWDIKVFNEVSRL
jgi:hypothetical protein